MRETKTGKIRWAAAQAVALLHLVLALVPLALMVPVEALAALLHLADRGLMWMLRGTLGTGDRIASRINPRPEMEE